MRMMILGALSGVVLAACASQPDYRDASRDGAQGYSEQVIEKDRYRVTYTGDRSQNGPEVRDLATLRAAELTMEKGGDWFEVVSNETNQDVDVDTRVGSRGFATRPGYVRDCGLLGCTTRAYPRAGVGTEVITETDVIFDHSIELIIHTGEKPAENTRAYDAAETAANLRAALD